METKENCFANMVTNLQRRILMSIKKVKDYADNAIKIGTTNTMILKHKPRTDNNDSRLLEDALAAENKKLRDLLDKLLDEYSFMSDRYWDGIYPSTPSKEMSDKHKEIVKAIREALK